MLWNRTPPHTSPLKKGVTLVHIKITPEATATDIHQVLRNKNEAFSLKTNLIKGNIALRGVYVKAKTKESEVPLLRQWF